MVAFGMVGASISGITFVSVPGMVLKTDMTYLQMCLGFIFGYMVVAFVLLPIYYRYNLTTIYGYLRLRLGEISYKTGALFFIISKMTGAAVRFFVVCIILQKFVLDGLGIPFIVTVPVMVLLIWLYTRKGGIKTLVWTDTFQTICMFAALLLIVFYVIQRLDMSLTDAIHAIAQDPHSRIFIFDDWVSKQNFWKQFLSGIFVVIVMTGLDQDMMQKNLTCRTLKEAQKDMCSYGLAFLPVNFLFLSLGVLLLFLAQKENIVLPQSADDILPMFTTSGLLGKATVVFFTIGIVAASFSSADSALTAITTSICVDLLSKPQDERLRKKIHVLIAFFFMLFIVAFKTLNSTSVIDAIYIICSYTYGPLLGLFAFCIFTNRSVRDKMTPVVAIASPTLCFIFDKIISDISGYQLGYELLMLNGLITFAGLSLFSGSPAKLKDAFGRRTYNGPFV